MLGWEFSLEHNRLHIEQMQREAEHRRMVRIATNGKESAIEALVGALGRSLILMGVRLLPAAPQPVVGANVVVLRGATDPCELAADPCVVC